MLVGCVSNHASTQSTTTEQMGLGDMPANVNISQFLSIVLSFYASITGRHVKWKKQQRDDQIQAGSNLRLIWPKTTLPCVKVAQRPSSLNTGM